MTMIRILVDMSATLFHHGHVRLLKKASESGLVVVALTSDADIQKIKGYVPEIAFEGRKEILESIRFVSEVIESPWLIDDNFLITHKIDFLVHGDDNVNLIPEEKLKIFPRTEGISSTIIRDRVLQVLASIEMRDGP